jgi:hypothetical protein
VGLCVYCKGAQEIVRRLQQALEAAQQWQGTHRPTREVQGPEIAYELFYCTLGQWPDGAALTLLAGSYVFGALGQQLLQ